MASFGWQFQRALSSLLSSKAGHQRYYPTFNDNEKYPTKTRKCLSIQYLLAPSSPILLLSQVLSSSKIHWRRCPQLKLLRRREAATAGADHWAICRLLGLSHRPRITSTWYLVTISDIDQDHKKFKFAILGYRYYYSCQSFASQPVCKILRLIELVFLGLTSAAFSESVLTCLDVIVGWNKLVWGNPSHT